MIRFRKGDGESFANLATALMAMQAAQMYFAHAGFFVTSYVNPRNHRIELSVHFDYKRYPTLPKGYLCSSYTVFTEQAYFGSTSKQSWIRVKEFNFKY